jgi:hypothetical protein
MHGPKYLDTPSRVSIDQQSNGQSLVGLGECLQRFHFIFLTFEERFRLSDDMPVFTAYARLSWSAVSSDIQQLREPRQPIGIEKGSTRKRAWRAAVALL